MVKAARALPVAFEQGSDVMAREDMSWAALLSGMALANAGLGVVHGFAAPLGGMLHAPHGAICAAILPHGMAVNVAALRERAPASKALNRYRQVAVWLTGEAEADAEAGVQFVAKLCSELAVRPLRSLGLMEQQISRVVERAAQASSMNGNPLPLLERELREVAERAW